MNNINSVITILYFKKSDTQTKTVHMSRDTQKIMSKKITNNSDFPWEKTEMGKVRNFAFFVYKY